MNNKVIKLVDTRHVPTFLLAAKYLNFTKAAKIANMTQSGVSQHIAQIENNLGLELFTRIGKKVSLTPAGKLFENYCQESINQFNDLLHLLDSSYNHLRGDVKYSITESFLCSQLFQKVLNISKNFPNISLLINTFDNKSSINKIINEEIDFAILNEKVSDKRLSFSKYITEEYLLIVPTYEMSLYSIEDILEQKFIRYENYDFYLKYWLENQDNIPPNYKIKPGSYFDSIQGALMMIKNELGVGVFPSLCVDHFIEQDNVYIWNMGKPIINQLYLTRLSNKLFCERVEASISWFLDARDIFKVNQKK